MNRKSLTFGKAQLLTAFDRLGDLAISNGVRLDIAVYGGSALMLAGNFRYATEDVDIGPIGKPWPKWLESAVAEISAEMNLADDWLNDAVEFHLSSLADFAADHVEFGTFPRGGDATGLSVYVPTAEYMLAMKLKAMRITDPGKGPVEASDILNLMKVVGVNNIDGAMDVLARYYPKSAADSGKHRFLLRVLLNRGAAENAPEYPARSL